MYRQEFNSTSGHMPEELHSIKHVSRKELEKDHIEKDTHKTKKSTHTRDDFQCIEGLIHQYYFI